MRVTIKFDIITSSNIERKKKRERERERRVLIAIVVGNFFGSLSCVIHNFIKL